MIVALAGLPGSGKSFLAEEIIRRYPHFALFNKDVVRQTLFPEALTDFSSEQNDLCMKIIFQAAAYLISKDSRQVVFIDGRTFSVSSQVDAVIVASKEIGTPCRFVQCVCSEETARERIVKGKEGHLAKNRDMDLYYSLKEKTDPLKVSHLRLETDDPALLDERIDRVITFISAEDYEVNL